MAFSNEVKTKALVACARHCCICHRFVGLKIECHHITHQSEGGTDEFENCIPLCFDCHGDMRSYDHNHPKGTKYSKKELLLHRDSWYQRVSNQTIVSDTSGSRFPDSEVYTRIRQSIPYDTIIFLKEQNFNGFAFPMKKLEPIFLYSDIGGDVDNEFIDIELESLRAELFSIARKISEIISTNTWPIKTRPAWSSVPPEWEVEQEERFWKVTGTIHSLNASFAESFDQLVRVARRKLGVQWKEPA